MHAQPSWAGTDRRPGRRAARAALCVSVVLLAHVVLGLLVTSPAVDPQPAAPSASVQVRRLVLPQVAAPAAAPLSARAEMRVPASRPRPVVRAANPPQPAQTPPEAAVHVDTQGLAAAAATPVTAGLPLPIYPTHIPPSALLTYTLQRGAFSGEATLHWRVDGERYRLQLQSTMPHGRPVERHSQGGFDEAGLAPSRLADQRGGRDVRAVNFQRERGVISFSSSRALWPLLSGAQDRLSWLVQLVAIASAAPAALHEGATVSMTVVGTRGAWSVWHFEVRGRESLGAGGGDAPVWWLVREPAHPYDTRVEVWLDPARGHWPVRLRQTQVPGGEALEWLLRGEPQPAQPS